VVPVSYGSGSAGFVTEDVFVAPGFDDEGSFSFFYSWNISTPRPMRVSSVCSRLEAVGAGLVVSQRPAANGEGYEVSICSLNGELRAKLPLFTRYSVNGGSYSGSLRVIALTPDGRKLITQAPEREVGVYDTATGKRLTGYQTPTFMGLALMPDSVHLYLYEQVLASTSSGLATRVRRFSLASSSPLQTFEMSDYSYPATNVLPVSPEGKYVGKHAVKSDGTFGAALDTLYSGFALEGGLTLGLSSGVLYRLPDGLPWRFLGEGKLHLSPNKSLVLAVKASSARLCAIQPPLA